MAIPFVLELIQADAWKRQGLVSVEELQKLSYQEVRQLVDDRTVIRAEVDHSAQKEGLAMKIANQGWNRPPKGSRRATFDRRAVHTSKLRQQEIRR